MAWIAVKHLSSRWVAAALIGPMLLVVGILLILRSGPEAATRSKNGFVQVAFTGGNLVTSDGAPISQEYQRVALNVDAVRLTPSNNLSLGEGDASWVGISAPAGIGLYNPTGYITTNLDLGGSLGNTEIGAAFSVLQLDFETLQNLPFFFNGAQIPAKTYLQVEVTLNPSNYGSVIPLCPHSMPAGEGCVAYPVTLAQQTQGTVVRTLFAHPYNVTPSTVQPLVINVALTVGPGPTISPSKSTVTLTPVITPQGNSVLPNSDVPYNPALGTVMGTVTNFTSATSVTAEFSGTSQVVASTKLMSNGTFVLNLPARATPDSTLYDFFVSGNGAYVVRSRVPVSSQGSSSGPPPVTDLGTLPVPPSNFGALSGAVFDTCTGTKIPASTLELLAPDTTVPGGGTTCDLTGEPPAIPSNCVVVATAATDDTGQYPLSATPAYPQSFASIPLTPPSGAPYYDVTVAAAGYNTSVQEVENASGGLTCPTAGFSGNACDFNLEHGYLAGTTDLSSPNDTGSQLNIVVIAEDSGTDKIENFGLSTIPGGVTSGSFSMPVPDASPSSARSLPVTNYDIFGAVQDLFQSAPQSTSGHSIAAASGVGAPDACATIGVSPPLSLSSFDCVGLGSVFGSINSANPNTTSVSLSKNGVQLMETEPNSIGAPPNGNTYNFCAPSDSYTLTHYESGVPESSTSVALAAPTAVASPCASICQNAQTSNGNCLLCQPTSAPALP